MTPLDILKAARAKIEKPECWGKGLRPYDRPSNTCCASEALADQGIWGDELTSAFMFFIGAIPDRQSGQTIPQWNDAPERTHQDVLKAFDRAIELASQP